MTEYHQTYSPDDGSVCVRIEAGDPWTVIKGDGNSAAMKFANIQNRFWKPWVKESVQHSGDAFSKHVRKPKP